MFAFPSVFALLALFDTFPPPPPLHIPSVVRTYGTVTTAHEWVLAKGTDGHLMARTFNYKTGLTEGYRVSNFDRGSSVRFSLHPHLAPGTFVAKGDTIGSIDSSELQERMIALNGQLIAARNVLAINASGSKAAIVREAEQRLQSAYRIKNEHQKTLNRAKRLFEAELISQGEYEAAQSKNNSLNDAISIAKSNLEAARTGAKPERLDLADANIAALENEIAALRNRAQAYTLIAPISGVVSRARSPETLLTISDTTSYVALIPVNWNDYARVADAKLPRVKLFAGGNTISGTVISLNPEIQLLWGSKVIIATAVLDSSVELIPGMLAKCQIECDSITVLEYIRQFFAALMA